MPQQLVHSMDYFGFHTIRHEHATLFHLKAMKMAEVQKTGVSRCV